MIKTKIQITIETPDQYHQVINELIRCLSDGEVPFRWKITTIEEEK